MKRTWTKKNLVGVVRNLSSAFLKLSLGRETVEGPAMNDTCHWYMPADAPRVWVTLRTGAQLEIRVYSRQGDRWPKAEQAPRDALLDAVEGLAAELQSGAARRRGGSG